jgi:hypothetical protein
VPFPRNPALRRDRLRVPRQIKSGSLCERACTPSHVHLRYRKTARTERREHEQPRSPTRQAWPGDGSWLASLVWPGCRQHEAKEQMIASQRDAVDGSHALGLTEA